MQPKNTAQGADGFLRGIALNIRFFFFVIILSLRIPKLVIFAVFVGDELIMGTLLDYAALMKNRNIVAETAGGKAVTYINGGFVTDYFIKF